MLASSLGQSYHKDMTLAQLRYLLALAETRHFGRAANRACVSQSALSMAIKDLETELEVILFERDRSGVWPTSVGERVIDKAREALRYCSEIEHMARQAQSPLHEPLNIGLCRTLAPYYLSRLGPALCTESTSARTVFQEAAYHQLLELLINGQLDMVLGVAYGSPPPSVLSKTVVADPVFVVMPHSHPLAQFSAITLSQLSHYELRVPDYGLKRFLEHLPGNPLTNLKIETHEVGLESYWRLLHLERVLGFVSGAQIHMAKLAIDGLAVRPFHPAIARPVSLHWRTSYPRPQNIDVVTSAITRLSDALHWQLSNSPHQTVLVDNGHW